MGIHTSLYFGVVEASTALAPVFGPVGAVVDQVLGNRNSAHVPGKPLSLVALAATGLTVANTLAVARVQSPKTVISPVYVRPVNALENFGDDPNVSSFVAQPVAMRAGEEISAAAWVVGAADDATVTIVAWFCDRHEPIPAVESYWVPFEVPLDDMTAGKWQSATLTFDGSPTLPAGRYAILGMQLVRPALEGSELCGRLVIPGETLRPGMITSPSFSARTPLIASDGSFGVWGYFDAQLPPSMEVFSSGTPTADTVLQGYLRVAQVDR